MCRTITNWLIGRNKTFDEDISIDRMLNLLKSEIKGNITYDAGYASIVRDGVLLSDMSDFIKSKFGGMNSYLDIKHQIYCGKVDEKHYLNLVQGDIEARLGSEIIKRRPDKKALITYRIKK